ncbi:MULTISPECIES: aromatic-ring hydroxylase C-terminal domain-containing protein [Bradyrhizobium]
MNAVLVRPDGFVAWATDIEPDLAQTIQAAARWFGKPDAAGSPPRL